MNASVCGTEAARFGCRAGRAAPRFSFGLMTALRLSGRTDDLND